MDYIAGDTIKQGATLYKNKATDTVLDIPTDGSATLIAFVADPKRRKVIIPAVSILKTDEGNDWPNGGIYFTFDQAKTGVLANYDGDEIVVAVRLTINLKHKTFKQYVKAVKMPLNIVAN